MSLIVLVGPAGVGKGSVVKELLKHGGYRLSVSATTREPRASEVDGQHYHFVSNRDFEQMIENAE
ncbi:MAG: guanylate kinase, partial [Aquiluna sp.]